MHPGADRTPERIGSSNTNPSEATLRNISQNMNGASVVRFDCEAEVVTVLYCSFGPVEDGPVALDMIHPF